MTDTLQILLENLHAAIEHTSSSKGIVASNVIKDIVSVCQDLATFSDLEYSSSLLFSEEYGVLEFVKGAINLKEFENAKADLLAFLETYLEVAGNFISQYAMAMKDVCLLVVNRDPSSKVKVEALNLLMKLLKLKNRSVQEKLDVFTMAERLFSLCLQSSKQSSSGVRGAILNTLGVIAERFPEHLTGKADRMSSIYLGTLKEQMVAVKKPDFLVITGCLRGLACYLVNYSKSLEGCSKYATELFGYIKTAIDPKLNLARYEVPKAALCLLEKHSFHFRQLITGSYQYIYLALCQWSRHGNKEIRVAAIIALDSCLFQISKHLVDEGKNAETMCILKYFIKHFHGVLNSESACIEEISMAVKGFGVFAEACRMLLSEGDLKLIFEEMLNRSQHLFSSIDKLAEDKMQNISTFLVSFSQILQQLCRISNVSLIPIERMIILLFENYPKLGKGGMFTFEKGLTHFIRVLAQNANVFSSCLSQIVYQGLIRTCSHPLPAEEGFSNEDDAVEREARITYQSYADLWLALLDEKRYRDHSVFDDFTVPKIMVNHVYDELIQSILLVMKKLNLAALNSSYMDPESYVSSESTARVSNFASDDALTVTTAKDIEIFINLVEFCREILLKSDAVCFYRWIPCFVKEIVVLSSRYPFVSGLYKLMEVNARLCCKLDYFKYSQEEKLAHNEDVTTYVLLSKFVKDVIGRIRQFKYDLLSSCLQFLLRVPVQFVEDSILSFARPVEMALKLGLSYDSLAVSAIDALEHWKNCISLSGMRRLLLEVLPYLDGYLQNSSEKQESENGYEETIPSGRSGHSRRNRVPTRLLKSLRDSNKATTSPLMQLRHRIVKFLGDLGGNINTAVVKGGKIPDISNAVGWSTAQHLSFALPFCDMKPTVYLDPFLPRTIELATTSSDRQTKVVSCELLHALTLFILGKSAQQTNQRLKQEGMNEIYIRLFPAVLKLACDIEQVAEQLFRPLAFQMIHWFTSNSSRTESPDTMNLLDAILDGLVNQDDNALREFSALCIREFLEWSIKQSSTKHSKTAVNPKALFKRIYSMAKHPNAYKRLGATSAFNSLYIIFREHEELVDVYILELLAYFLESLAMAHDDEPVIGTVERSKQAIDHIARIIKQKSDLLFKRNRHRRVPPALHPFDSTEFTIDHMFVWMLRQCGSPKTECRHKCMELLYNLLPTQPGISHARTWFENTLNSDGPKFFIEKFEGYGFANSGSGRLSPGLAEQGSIIRVKDLVYWHEGYLAALDCYIWSSNAQLVKPAKIFENSSSVLLECIGFFVKELAVNDLETLMVMLLRAGMKNDPHQITPLEKEKYNRTKCTSIVRTMDFLCSTLTTGMWRNDYFAVQRKRIFSVDFHLLLCRCIYHPESLGFNVGDIEILQNLPDQLQSLLIAMKKGLPLPTFTSFITYMTSFLSKQRYDLAAHLPIDLRSKSMQNNQKCLEVQQLVSGFHLLYKTGILKDCRKQQDISCLSASLFSNVIDGLLPYLYDSDVTIVPAQKSLAESFLILALHLQDENEHIIQILLDENPLENMQGKSKIASRGSVFYQSFKSTVNGYIIESDGSIISKIMNRKTSNQIQIAIIVQDLIEFVAKRTNGADKVAKTRRDTVVNTVVEQWMALMPLWKSEGVMEGKMLISNILRNLLTINAKSTLVSSGLNPSPPFATYLQLLSDSSTGLRFKTQMFEVLPALVDGLDEDMRSILRKRILDEETFIFDLLELMVMELRFRNTLKNFIAETFPISSADLMIGTTRHSEYSNCIHQLFRCLAMSCSHVMVDVLLTVIVKETDDIYENVIISSLKSLSKRICSKEAERCLNLCFKIILDEEHHSNDIRKGVTNRVILVLLRTLDSTVVKQFYVVNIKTIMQKCEARLAKQFESIFEGHLVTKICCFKLVQALYVIFSKEEVSTKQSAIVKAAFPYSDTGKELTQAVTKAAQSAKSEDCRGETMLIDLRREYHCSAYNALCAVIACTQTEQKFYTGFLFTENRIKSQMLWENIINTDQHLSFEAEQTVPFARKKQLQMIRRSREVSQEVDDLETRGFLQYLSSQYLMNSSLSEDVSKFDFSTPIHAYSTATSPQFLRSQLSRGAKKYSEDNEGDVPLSSEDILEMDSVNKNESMSVLVSLLRHMKDSRIYDHPDEGKEGCEMPTWMNCLFKKFGSNETILNVKIFILKLIINVPKIFESYGKFWFPVIVQFIVSEQIPGDRLSYFIVDAIVVMLSWSDTCIPEDTVVGRNLASSLLDYLIRNCHHNNRGVLKHNLQVIKTLTKVWKNLLEINYRSIYQMFSYSDQDTKDNMTGIQILGVILTNGFEPHCTKSSVDEEKYYAALIQNLAFKYKDVFASAAEVIGLAMKHITHNFDSVDCPIFMQTYQKLIELGSSSVEKFITCLHRIQLNYPLIVDKFTMKLLYILPSIHGDLRQHCLETLASRADSFEEPNSIFVELKGMGLDASINHRDEGVQLASIDLFNGLLKSLPVNEIFPILKSIAKLRHQSSVLLRDKMYEIFMWIFDTYRLDEHSLENEESIEILKLSKEVLLLGINDKNTNISLKVLNFWRHETRLPISTIERFIEILRALYSTKTEKEYLSYFTNLLLQLTSLSPDYSLPLFNEPLDSSKRFEEYHVNFSWQRQKIAMTPLFAASQIQSQLSSQSSSLSTGMLRATQQSLQFTPTQQETNSSENWMNPTFQIGSEEHLLSQTMPSQSSFLLLSTELENKRGFNVGLLRRSDDAGAQSGNEKLEQNYDIMKLKKRIWKSKEKTSSYFALKEKRSQKLRQIAAQRQKAARDHKVVMYRKYRKGELPDIQIKHSELIVPLQAAAQCDSIIARELFKMLFDALVIELPDKFSEDIMEKAHLDIQGAIHGMMNDSIMFHPPFVYALEDACYRNKNLKLDANVISMASKTGVQHPIGIMLLEKQLLDDGSKEPSRKRKRSEHNQNENFLAWIELAKLYRSIDKYDFVHTIFSSQITKQEYARLALECEERNDYAKALKYYNQLTSTNILQDQEPSQEEEEFWDIARLMCYDNLAKWSNLKTLTLQSIDDDSPSDIDKIWSDVHLQEQFLPYYIRSNLKMICHGESEADVEQFCTFIDEGLRNEERKEILESKFYDDLAFLKLLQENYGAAKHYINLGIQGFCEEWSNVSSLLKESRLAAVSRLQKLYEMMEFTDLISKDDLNVNNIKEILRSWSERQLDENLNSMSVWDDVMINRCTYLKKMKQKTSGTERSGEITELLDIEGANFLLKIAEVARKRGNFSLASKYLRESYNSTVKDHDRNNELTVKWYHVYAHVNREKAKMLPLFEAVPSLFTILEQLHDTGSIAKKQITWSLQHHLQQIETLDCLTKIIANQDMSDLRSLVGNEQQHIFQKIFGALPPLHIDSFLDFVHECSYTCLGSAVASSHQMSTDVPENRSLIEKALMTMVKFCDERLKENEENETEFMKKSEYADIVMRYTLKSMTFDSTDARLRFPRLLQILDHYPETICLFSKKVDEVPSWMFLAWLNQIVAAIDKTEGVFQVLSNIAKDYPHALTYPLRISSDQFSFDNSPEGNRKKNELARLLTITHNALCDEFIDALEQLSDPAIVFEETVSLPLEEFISIATTSWNSELERVLISFSAEPDAFFVGLANDGKCQLFTLFSKFIFNDWVGDMLKLLEVKRRDASAIRRCFGCIWRRLFKPMERNDIIKGDLHKKCSKVFSKVIGEYFGKDGSNIIDMPAKAFKSKRMELAKELKELRQFNLELKAYSPWFASIQRIQGDRFIEVPGQYTGQQKPLPEYHVRIAGFDEKVLVLQSLRRPKRIKIIGHDEKEYSFLVKGGEDLRLDQRIEQLFEIMNGILHKDPTCSAKSLKLKTYQVIPLTTRTGILQWVANSATLKGFMENVYSDAERIFLEKNNRPGQEYNKFVNLYTSSGGSSTAQLYKNLFKNAKRPEVVKSFEGIQGMIPWDLLRRALDRLSASTEAYFVLRNHFIQTYSCLCICHYIFGIGDRHLDNLMISKRNGGVIGIDFGYSFGSSTTILPVPELMPFRLTGQFRNLLLPLTDLGPYRIPMTDVMRALRSESDLLLNTMDVFVQEPLIDWQVNAQKQLNPLDTTDKSMTWYPKEKISICNQKLNGINCAHITSEELKLRLHQCEEFHVVAHGFSEHNIRKRYMEKAASHGPVSRYTLQPEEQVACLIDQATDFNILGRTYAGWAPYL